MHFHIFPRPKTSKNQHLFQTLPFCESPNVVVHHHGGQTPPTFSCTKAASFFKAQWRCQWPPWSLDWKWCLEKFPPPKKIYIHHLEAPFKEGVPEPRSLGDENSPYVILTTYIHRDDPPSRGDFFSLIGILGIPPGKDRWRSPLPLVLVKIMSPKTHPPKLDLFSLL